MDVAPRDGSPLTPHDPRLAPWRAFVFAQMAVVRRLDEDLRSEHDLSMQEYGALLALAEAPGRRLRMGRLAETVSISKSGATRLIDRLGHDGLVLRTSCASDARGAEATLTESGLARLRAAVPTHLRGIAEYFFAAIAESDLAGLERAMNAVRRHLDATALEALAPAAAPAPRPEATAPAPEALARDAVASARSAR